MAIAKFQQPYVTFDTRRADKAFFRIFPQKSMQTLVGGDSWNTSRWQRKGLVTNH